jgi:archaellum component FlaF (FlaF/FlaG flagellin family)
MRKILSQSSLRIFLSFCLLFLFGCKEKAITENDELTPTDSITVLLDVKVSSREVIVGTTFYNNLNVTVKIDKFDILYRNTIHWCAFKVVRGKKKIPYIGLMVYRLPPRKEDLYNLMPGGSYTSRIKLHNFYNLSRSGTYTVTYEGLWWLPDEKGNDYLFCVRSNTVEFKLKKGIPPPAYE